MPCGRPFALSSRSSPPHWPSTAHRPARRLRLQDPQPSAEADARAPPPGPLLSTPSSRPLDLNNYPPDALEPLLATPSAKPLDLSQYIPDEATALQNGAYGGLPQQLHTPPRGPPIELATIKPMDNMYQLDLIYADLFSLTGRSMICGAAAMANAIKFLRVSRRPPMIELAQRSVQAGASDQDWMRTAFARCRVSRSEGSTDRELLTCARGFLKEGRYPAADATLRSMWAKRAPSGRIAPQLADLSSVIRQNRAAVLLFGWYTASQNPLTHAWSYTRTGGHFVALAGYDRADAHRIYVSNPLIDYAAMGAKPISALVMEPVGPKISFAKLSGTPSEDINTAAGGKWQTRDLTAHRIAVLESMVVVGPSGPMKAASTAG